MAGIQDEIRAVFDQMIEAQNAGDAERVRSMLSQRPDAVHIGTDAEEWWTSKQVADAVAAVGGTDDIQAVSDDTEIHVQGDVAWAEGRGRFTSAGGGERPAGDEAAGADDRCVCPRGWPVEGRAVARVHRGPERGHLRLAPTR